MPKVYYFSSLLNYPFCLSLSSPQLSRSFAPVNGCYCCATQHYITHALKALWVSASSDQTCQLTHAPLRRKISNVIALQCHHTSLTPIVFSVIYMCCGTYGAQLDSIQVKTCFGWNFFILMHQCQEAGKYGSKIHPSVFYR